MQIRKKVFLEAPHGDNIIKLQEKYHVTSLKFKSYTNWESIIVTMWSNPIILTVLDQSAINLHKLNWGPDLHHVQFLVLHISDHIWICYATFTLFDKQCKYPSTVTTRKKTKKLLKDLRHLWSLHHEHLE